MIVLGSAFLDYRASLPSWSLLSGSRRSLCSPMAVPSPSTTSLLTPAVMRRLDDRMPLMALVVRTLTMTIAMAMPMAMELAPSHQDHLLSWRLSIRTLTVPRRSRSFSSEKIAGERAPAAPVSQRVSPTAVSTLLMRAVRLLALCCFEGANFRTRSTRLLMRRRRTPRILTCPKHPDGRTSTTQASRCSRLGTD